MDSFQGEVLASLIIGLGGWIYWVTFSIHNQKKGLAVLAKQMDMTDRIYNLLSKRLR